MAEKTYSDLEQELANLQAEMAGVLAKMQAQMVEKGKEYMTKVVKALFDTYPELESFAWTQYTPYFMDGDPCEFGVNDSVFINADHDKGDLYDYEYYWSSYYEQKADKEGRELEWQYRLARDVSKMLRSIGDDTLKQFFGDHALITVAADGIDVTEYSHD